MCGRYTLYSTWDELADYFFAKPLYSITKSYNITPSTRVAVMLTVDNRRIITLMRWGLIPFWYKQDQALPSLINAKIETVDIKPAFRNAFKKRRCLILANGFYEWDANTKPKQPYYFTRNNQRPFALAGIWETWSTMDTTIESCAIITEPANELVSNVHHRMPAIIKSEDYDNWLDTQNNELSTTKHLAQMPDAYDGMTYYPVTPKMNHASYDKITCIKPI